MRTPFFKMHGLGNDFVVLDERLGDLSLTRSRISALADRKRGIGCDQLVSLRKPEAGDPASVVVRFFNPDGSEAGACGNASRCVAWMVAGEEGKSEVSLRTSAGLLPSIVQDENHVTVDMGEPRLSWRDVPLVREMDTLRLPMPGEPAALSMGNPHVTFFSDNDASAERGALLECDALFPERANIGFASIKAPDVMRLRVWERGAGFTLACGSGACAAVVNAARRGLGERKMRVLVDGGELTIDWGHDNHVRMTGPVATAFVGTVDLTDYPT